MAEYSISTQFKDTTSLPKSSSTNNYIELEEMKESNEFRNSIDVRYMESLRAINDKIKSCISCDENECPVLKERMNRHIIKHHSFTNGERLSSQNCPPAKLYRNSILISDDQPYINNYNKLLRKEIEEWSKEIPVYPNQIFEIKKQNLINLLIENINHMYQNFDDEDYNFKLNNVINSFINSLSGLENGKPISGELKESLLDHIYKLNNKFHTVKGTETADIKRVSNNLGEDPIATELINIPKQSEEDKENTKRNNHVDSFNTEIKTNSSFTATRENNLSQEKGHLREILRDPSFNFTRENVLTEKLEVEDVATSTLADNILKSPKMKNNSTNTIIEYYNEVIGPDIFIYDDRIKINNNLVNAQVQVSRSLINNCVRNDNSIHELNKRRVKEGSYRKALFIQRVFDWINNLIENENYNFVNRKVDKNVIANILWDELKVCLTNQSNDQNKLMLKRKILDIIDQMPLSTAKLNPIFKYKIAEDLNNKVLNLTKKCSDRHFKSKRCTESNDDKISTTVKQKLRNILLQSLKSFGLENIQDDIVNIFLHIMSKNKNKKLIKEELYIALRTLVDLPPIEIFELVNFITERTINLSKILNYNDNSSMIARNFGPAAMTIYSSEQELNGPTISRKRRSSVRLHEIPKLSSYEIIHVNKIVEVINLWLDTLPKEFKSYEKDKNVQDLARELYNQIALEERGEETALESNKFKTFIIRKWLERFDFFEKLSEAKPYIELLVKRINGISLVYSQQQQDSLAVCCGIKAKDTEPECLMKELILTFLEYHFSEDNSDTRRLFAFIFKSELLNLSLPSRKEVYDSLEKNMLNGIPSFKRLDKELQYIMAISEYIQDIPLNDSHFTNKQLNTFINRFAENIYLVEQQLNNSTNLEDLVRKFVEELPICTSLGITGSGSITVKKILNKIGEIQTSRPSCCFAKTSQVNSSIDSLHTLSDYIESFICDNYQKLTGDERILEACSMRLLKEINNLIIENPNAFNTTEVYKRLGNNSMASGEIVRRFSAELKYAKEISDWLHNLPLLPVSNENDYIGRIQKISELIRKMLEYIENNDQAYFKGYIETWLKSFPFDSRKEIIVPVVIQQLLNRIERMNKDKQKQKSNIVCQAPVPCCSFGKNNLKKTIDPAEVIVETIEKWCSDLPLNGDTENINIMKDRIATKLYQKVGDINNNFMYFNNDELYRDALSQEIDTLLETVPLNKEFRQEYLKNKLVNIIMDNKKILNKKILGNEYKQRLEDQIAKSVPNSVSMPEDDDPGFEIYKDRIAMMFILDNFDYSHNAVKLKYEKKIREKIDKFHEYALKRNAISITKDQMFVELYSTLFRVPIPNEESVSEEVEEIKTRCEIEIWFENLPLRKATGLEELLQWDKILSMLARRIHHIENNEVNPDDKIYIEINKWLRKLPLLPNKEAYFDQFSSELQIRLKSTSAMRKCVTQIDISRLLEKVNSRTGSDPYQRQIPLPKCCQIRPKEVKKPADLIIETVESWCRDLPIPANTPQEKDDVKLFKDNMVIKIIMKISELNMNPEIFNDRNLYNTLLDDELESIFSSLPSCCDYMDSKNIRKEQLIQAINSVKPMINEENSRFKYKQELKNVVNDVLENPCLQNTQNSEIVSEIVDNFVMYHYYKDETDGKHNYKIMINNAVKKYIRAGYINLNNNSKEPLLKSNQIVCELSKVPSPSDKVLNDEVEEIRMKFEVSEFLKELPVNGNEEKVPVYSQIKAILARRLSDLEKSGHNQEIEHKMKDEVKKCLRKMNESIDNVQIDSFIERLRNTEQLRKSHPLHIYDKNENNDTFMTPPIANTLQETPHHLTDHDISYPKTNSDTDQWLSLLPATPQTHKKTRKNGDNQNTLCSSTCTRNTHDIDHGISYKNANELGTSSTSCGHENNQSKCFSHLSNHDNNFSFTPKASSTYRNNQLANQNNSNINAEIFIDGLRITSTPARQDARIEKNNYELFGRIQQSSISHQSYRRPTLTTKSPTLPFQNQLPNERPQSNTNTKQSCHQQNSITVASDTNQSLEQQLEVTGIQLNGSRSPTKTCSEPDMEEHTHHYARYQISSDLIPSGGFNCNLSPTVAKSPCRRMHKRDQNSATNQQKIQGASKTCKRTTMVTGSKTPLQSCIKQLESHIQSYECGKDETDDDSACNCSKTMLKAKPFCSVNKNLKNEETDKEEIKKHCKIYNNHFTMTTCRYPGFYY